MLTVVVIFILVYLGMLLGGVPLLQLDRTGIALLGTIALLVTKSITMEDAERAIHVPTLILLFAFMVVAAQLRLGGFYDWVTAELGALRVGPGILLGALITLVGGLAAVFSNDVVCLSIAPLLIDVCRHRQLDPIPFLLALACSANIGSAATLIGNPQNILIGERLHLSFGDYTTAAIGPVAAGLFLTWLIIALRWRQRWHLSVPLPRLDAGAHQAVFTRLNVWQSLKGLSVAGTVFALFTLSDWPRDIVALGAAGLLLLSRKLHSRTMLGLVDWQVLLLFIGLFIVNDALEQTGLPQQAVSELALLGVDLRQPAVLYGVTFLLSNLVSNVPAIMLLLPFASPADGVLLALCSTLAGNLLIVGSIANIIVIGAAAQRDIAIGWRQHAAVGVPVTVLTLAVAAWYLF